MVNSSDQCVTCEALKVCEWHHLANQTQILDLTATVIKAPYESINVVVQFRFEMSKSLFNFNKSYKLENSNETYIVNL